MVVCLSWTGSLFFQKLLPNLLQYCHPESLFINIGSSLGISTTQPLIEQFWSESYWLADEKRKQQLMKNHGNRSQSVLKFVRESAGKENGILFLTADERRELFAGKYASAHCYYVQGKEDIPYPLAELEAFIAVTTATLKESGRRRRVWTVNSGHFTYFNDPCWPSVALAIQSIIDLHGRKDLLLPPADLSSEPVGARL